MRILFISRAFPPVTGGIENQNHALSVWLPKLAETKTLANHHGKQALPFFLPWVTLQALFLLPRYDVVLLGDGVLALTGRILKFFYPGKPVLSIVHGLDLTYQNSLYQTFWVKRFLPKLDGLIAVSRETAALAKERGILESTVVVIPNGVEVEHESPSSSRSDLESLLGESLANKHILLTMGRLIKRKGAAWFIREVLPQLPKNTLYVLAGAGPEQRSIEQAIEEKGLENQVKLLGYVSEETKKLLLNTADIFIQPNVPVPGDIEGFGIAVIEATAWGLPVVASNLEGLKDAICDKENGMLVESGNREAFRAAIIELLTQEEERRNLGKRAKHYTETHFHWNLIARLYIETLERKIT